MAHTFRTSAPSSLTSALHRCSSSTDLRLIAGQFKRYSTRHEERNSNVEQSCCSKATLGIELAETKNTRQLKGDPRAFLGSAVAPVPFGFDEFTPLSCAFSAAMSMDSHFLFRARCNSSAIVNEPNNTAVRHPCSSDGNACGHGCQFNSGNESVLLCLRAKRIASSRSRKTWRPLYWTWGHQEAPRCLASFRCRAGHRLPREKEDRTGHLVKTSSSIIEKPSVTEMSVASGG